MKNSELNPKDKVVALSCKCQNYGWGKIGTEGTVAQLVKNQPGFTVDESIPYAELWMGSHPNGPSKLQKTAGENDISLGNWIEQHPSVLGKNINDRFGNNLPYLFKVLSINKALSIQAHPSKEHAEILHKERPDIYKDPNHKPEMAIALTKFEALCGFRPVSEILNYFHDVHEFLSVVGQDAVDGLINAEMASEKGNKGAAVQKALRHCVSCLMTCDAEIVRVQLKKLVERLHECHDNKEHTTPYLGRLFLRIHEHFPGDVGCFIIYFLNYVQLEPYESIFMGPNVPHAYLSGDIIECMACSDNVVRAGLTPKYKDVDTLISMLNYTPKTVEESKFYPVQEKGDAYTSIYDPPVDDFAVKKIQIPLGSLSEYNLTALNGPSILLVITGECDLMYNNKSDGLKLQRGSVCFVSSDENVALTKISSNQELLIFQAYCELKTEKT